MKVITNTGAVVDAVRFDQAEVFARMGYIGMDLETGVSFREPTAPFILTRDGQQDVTHGDWILTYPDGRTEALSPADFNARFRSASAGVGR